MLSGKKTHSRSGSSRVRRSTHFCEGALLPVHWLGEGDPWQRRYVWSWDPPSFSVHRAPVTTVAAA